MYRHSCEVAFLCLKSIQILQGDFELGISVEFEDISTLTFKNIKFHKSSIRSVKDKNYLQHVLRFHSNSMLQTNSYLK